MARKELLRHDKNFFAYGFVHDYNEAYVSYHSRFSVVMCIKRNMLLLQNYTIRTGYKILQWLTINSKSSNENEIMDYT